VLNFVRLQLAFKPMNSQKYGIIVVITL
jgi:hypothetical protein